MGHKVINFMLALSVHNKKAFDFVSANLHSVGNRWIERITATRRTPPFIGLSESQVVEKIISRCDQIRHMAGNQSCRISFSVGIDATVLVRSFGIHQASHAIVGGVTPNIMLDIGGLSSDQVNAMLKDCIDGRMGVMAAEVKVAVVSFQNTPPGISPYFVLCGLPQTINDSNDYTERVIKYCNQAAKSDANIAVLNASTDGVSCEVEFNKICTLKYLDGKSNTISLPDTNHNVKNLRYQLIGGSSAATLGHYCFDPYMLLIAGVTKEVIRVEDYASDALVLRLASVKTIEKLNRLEIEDVGNAAITKLSLLFLRARSYAVNAIRIHWKTRAILHLSSLLWFASFHTSGSTMLANKHNMVLETFGLLFLVTRDDVSQLRRVTSECNEHIYGNWRQILREFNMEQLIDLVNKVSIRTEAIFRSGLLEWRGKSSGGGYQSTTGDFVKSLQDMASCEGLSTMCGSVHVNLECSAVDQLWSEVEGVIKSVNVLMIPFLSLFGSVKGNGLSPFARDFSSPKV
jgi:hypothetical protein